MATAETTNQAGMQYTCNCCGATIQVVKPCTCDDARGQAFKCACGAEMKPKS